MVPNFLAGRVSIHAPRAATSSRSDNRVLVLACFNHAPRAVAEATPGDSLSAKGQFQSTPRRATIAAVYAVRLVPPFPIHAPRGANPWRSVGRSGLRSFNPRPAQRGRRLVLHTGRSSEVSIHARAYSELRRAEPSRHSILFNPRPARGGGQFNHRRMTRWGSVSIRAPRAWLFLDCRAMVKPGECFNPRPARPRVGEVGNANRFNPRPRARRTRMLHNFGFTGRFNPRPGPARTDLLLQGWQKVHVSIRPARGGSRLRMPL